jgi:hypothetical protein
LDIRNQDYVRQGAGNPNIIPIQEHLKWVERLKTDSTKHYMMVFHDETLVGGVNLFDITHSSAGWGIFFSETVAPLIPQLSTYWLLNFAFTQYPINFLFSDVNVLNTQAFRFSLSFGLQTEKEVIIQNAKYYRMILTKGKWTTYKNEKHLTSIRKRLKKIDISVS